MNSREFDINEYITLKLENNQTIIYVNGERFNQCKFLFIRNLSINEMTDFIDDINSIDEEADNLDLIMEYRSNMVVIIPPETEFWGHCSNLQVWYENQYNSRLLHRNLAFPLLKKLTEVGDPLAKKVFKEEIARRLASRHLPVIEYLIEEQYINYLDSVGLLYNVLVPEEAEVLLELEKNFNSENKKNFWLVMELEYQLAPCFTIKNRHVIGLDLFECGLKSIPLCLKELKSLEILSVRYNKLKEFPDFLSSMPNLREIHAGGNNITIQKSLRHLIK